MTDSELQQHLISLEQERCRAAAAQDVDALRRVLSEQLAHVHTKGNVDTRDGYFRFAQNVVEILELTRGPLTVRRLGDGAAVMLGRQTNRSRVRATGAEVTTEAQVMQVWALEVDGQWRLAAFQGTVVASPAA